MTRAYSLQDYEKQQQQILEQERMQLLAQFGAATLQRETLRRQMENLDLRRRAFVDAVAQRNGITEYRQVAIQGDQLIADIMEPPQSLPTMPVAKPEESVSVINGRG